jgi:SAM-dependent methyltransferase
MSDQVSCWVRRFAPLIQAGEVLDLACGAGRHARHLAALGHPVLALDRDPAALKQAAAPGIHTVCFDLEAAGASWPFGAQRFAGIVVTNYLHRPLFSDLLASLAPDGVLIYETFARGNAQFGKPSNPAFLLEPGELIERAAGAGLSVVAYEDGRVGLPQAAMLQRLCAAGPAFDRQAALLAAF